MSTKLTAAFVKSATPPEKGRQIWYDSHPDSPRGFGLRVTANGARAFILRYKPPSGVDRILTIGSFPSWSLDAARAQARETRQEIEKGADPLEDARVELARRAAAEVEVERSRELSERFTLSALCDVYAAHLKAKGKDRSAANAISAFKVHLTDPPELAAIAKTPARDVTPEQIAFVIRRVGDSGKSRTAGILRSYLNAAFVAARKAPYDTSLPAELIPFGVQNNPVELIATIPVNRSKRTLTVDELKAYISALDDSLTDQALKLALYAGGQRMAQLLRARAQDFDPEQNTLLLWDGKGRRKEPRAHLIPLGPVASSIVAALVERAKENAEKRSTRSRQPIDPNPALFLSRGRVMADTTPGKRLPQIVADQNLTPFDLRDVRRTCETMLAKLGVSKDIRAQLLSHELGGLQATRYDMHDYISEKRKALGDWERHLARLVDGAPENNVVELRRGGANA